MVNINCLFLNFKINYIKFIMIFIHLEMTLGTLKGDYLFFLVNIFTVKNSKAV